MALRINSLLLALAIGLANLCCIARAQPQTVLASSTAHEHPCCQKDRPSSDPAQKPAQEKSDCCRMAPLLSSDPVKLPQHFHAWGGLVQAVALAMPIPVIAGPVSLASDLPIPRGSPPTLLALHCALVQ